MDNETTMPGLLTLPGTLDPAHAGKKGRLLLYRFIFAVALLALVLGFCLY